MGEAHLSADITDGGGRAATDVPAHAWEYLIVALPDFGAAATSQGESPSVSLLNKEGTQGWEAIGMTSLDGGHVAVLLKRASNLSGWEHATKELLPDAHGSNRTDRTRDVPHERLAR